MITAIEAYNITTDNINRYAKEFITNVMEEEIRGAADEGLFLTQVDVKTIRGGEVTAKEVVRLLKESGYHAEHVCNEYSDTYENCIYVNWGYANNDI
jgi:hypothetical protein